MSSKQLHIDARDLSIEDSLLLSALVCGVSSENPLIHRLQLFFCANFIIGKNNAEEDFQRCIETEVDKQSSTKYWNRASRGIYELTTHGYNHSKIVFSNIKPQFCPADDIKNVRYKLSGRYNNKNIIFERFGKSVVVTISNNYFTNMKDACLYLGFTTEGRSGARILYNLAVRNQFEVVFLSFPS
ncbi:MAG: hypothetical protein WCD80_04990 [Desulfobaccales bacterium]